MRENQTMKLMVFIFFIGLIVFFIGFISLIISVNPIYLIPTGIGYFMFVYSVMWMSADDWNRVRERLS